MTARMFSKRLYEVLKPFWGAVATIALYLLTTQILQMAAPYILGRIINAYSVKAPLWSITKLALLGFLVFVAKNFITLLRERYEIRRFDNSIQLHLAGITLKRLFSWSIAQHRQQHSGMVQSIVVEGEQSLANAAHLITFEMFELVSQMLLTTGLIFWISPFLGSIMITVGILFSAATWKLNMHIREDILAYEDKKHAVSKAYIEIERNAAFVLTQAQEDREIAVCLRAHSELKTFGERFWVWYCNWASVRSLQLGIGECATIILAGYMVAYKGYTPGLMVTFILWAQSLFAKMYTIGPIVRKSYRFWPAVVAYFELIAIQPELVQDPHPARPEIIRGKIEAQDIAFWHDRENNAAPTLVDMNFSINPGEKIGIVGSSGAGKSTLVSLLLRATDPNEGRILIDDIDLRHYDIKQYRRAVGFVEQHVPVLDRSLRDNMLFGVEYQEAVSMARLEEVARLCRIDEFLSSLPDGFDTMLGEQGVRLSGGQCQRVGIARALLKNPSILIFDEATSNLDSENEFYVREAIDAVSKDRTTIIIAHRLATVRDCDRIFMIKDGRLVGQDVHTQLMATCPAYSTLVGRQLLN